MKKLFTIILISIGFSINAQLASDFVTGNGIASLSEFDSAGGCHIYGKIKIVEYGEDYKVKFVEYGQDLKIKYVSYGEDKVGKWKLVEYGEDYKIKIVDYGENYKVKDVDYGEGCD